MENDNNNGGIGSASDMGNMEGTMVGNGGGGPTDPFGGGDAPGVGIGVSDKTGEASGSVGGKAEPATPGTLDTDLQPASPMTAVIDSQHLDQPSQPSFIAANLTTTDISKLGGNFAAIAATVGATLTGGVTAGPLGVLSAYQLLGNLDAGVIQRATMDAQLGMGNPGAFATESSGSSFGVNGMTEQSSVLSWDQINPSASGGGGGGG